MQNLKRARARYRQEELDAIWTFAKGKSLAQLVIAKTPSGGMLGFYRNKYSIVPPFQNPVAAEEIKVVVGFDWYGYPVVVGDTVYSFSEEKRIVIEDYSMEDQRRLRRDWEF